MIDLANIPKQGQTQESLREQLRDIVEVANRLGRYDAADYINTVLHKHHILCRWVDANETLPLVPKDKHAVSIIMSLVDPILDELDPSNGCSVVHGIYDSENGFQIIGYGGKGDWGFYPVIDIVTHWMYELKPYAHLA